MSYASWFGVEQTIPNNSAITQVSQNGSNYTTTVNVVPQVLSRTSVLSTMVDEARTTFFTASNVSPGLYKAGLYYQIGTGAADVWQIGDYVSVYVAGQDYMNNPTNGNAQTFYRTRPTTVNPYYGVSPTASNAPNGSLFGQHYGYLNISSIQNVNWVAFMEDFADNPATHAVVLADPWIQKIG